MLYVFFGTLCLCLCLVWYLSRNSFEDSDFCSEFEPCPDDEAMFFAPTIASVASAGGTSFILCLSSGNYDGLGEIRKTELFESAAVLQICKSHVSCLDRYEFQDGPDFWWPKSRIADVVSEFIEEHKIDSIVTFDSGGVSGHINHISVFEGVRYLATVLPDVRYFKLETTNLQRKYAGAFDVVPSALSVGFGANPRGLLTLTSDPSLAFRAMRAHASQFVWFRYLFVLFSRYTLMNTLTPLEDDDDSSQGECSVQ